MKIVIGVNPLVKVDAIAVIENNNGHRIYIPFNKALYKDLLYYLKESMLFYKGHPLITIENHNDKSIVLVF